LPGAGPAVLKAPDFTDGTIEFDYEPHDPSFAMVFFRWQNADENECFYFRTGRAGIKIRIVGQRKPLSESQHY
jgi:hypothetical protein